MLHAAAADAGVQLRQIEARQQSPDHPILWNVPETNYLKFFDTLTKNFNENLYLGLKKHEVHYAKYPEKGFYKPHLDNFQGKNKRVITVITYLNKEWRQEDGGTLHLHLPEGIKEIQPKAGSIIVFLSDKILHEVTTSYKERQSLTGWLLNSN